MNNFSKASSNYFVERTKPFGTINGIAGGIGGFARPAGYRPLSKGQELALQECGAPMPYGYTGVWKGQHYYKGERWTGSTNTMGRRS